MYNIERFEDAEWKLASSHSQLEDAQVQWQRFIDNGISENDLRKVGW